MTGLILKDFLILRKSLRTYLLMIVLYAALGFTGVWGPEMVCSFLVVVIAIVPMNVFAYDKQANWDTYGLALPVGRTKTVAARYAVVLLLWVASIALVIMFGVVVGTMGRLEGFGTYVFTGAFLSLIAMLVNAVMLPLLYKFGPEQARIMFFGLMGFLFFAGWLFLIPLNGLKWLKGWEPDLAQIAATPVIIALACLILLSLSFLLSRHFYGVKDV